jgi:hypothetical protein
MKSTEFLQAAIDVQAERGKQYDKPSGERSMAATVSAFNCITGSMLEESDGWMFLGLLKLVRQSQNPEQYHHDSALDFVAYASLYAEAASEQCGQLEAKLEVDASNVNSNVPEGIYLKQAPEWAGWLALDDEGAHWFEDEPEDREGDGNYSFPRGRYECIDEISRPMKKIKIPTSTAQ